MNYTQTFGPKTHIIGISGIIGVGKSTLSKNLGDELGFNVIKEPVETNEYLSSFYNDMKKYSFPMQIYLLNARFKQHQQMVWSDNSSIQDRTIYEDVIFAKMLHESNMIEDLDFKTYVELFNNMSNFLHRPDIILYLDVNPEIALKRINSRSRNCESGISLEYLYALKKGYEEWLDDIKERIPVIYLDWNSYQDPHKIANIIKDKIKSKKGLVI
jgi:deoxyadenosine kinase